MTGLELGLYLVQAVFILGVYVVVTAAATAGTRALRRVLERRRRQ